MKRFGLFVGINAYGDEADLVGARPDAERTSQLFERHFDSVTLLTDGEARRICILRVLEELCKQMSNGDILLFFFSGHGCECNGNQVLVLTGDGNGGRDSITLGELETATRRPGIRRVFVFDCCRNVDPNGQPVTQNLYALRAVPEYVAANGLMPPLVLSSCASGEHSFDDPRAAMGYFTRAFARALKSRNVRCFRDFYKVFREKMKDFVLPDIQNPEVNDSFWTDIQLLPHWRKSRDRLCGRVALSAESAGGAMALVGIDCCSESLAKSESCARFCAQMADVVRDFGEGVIANDEIMSDRVERIADGVYIGQAVRYSQAAGCLLSGYVHDDRIGVLLDLGYEKASSLKKDQLKEVAHQICLHICSNAPRYVEPQDIPSSEISEYVESEINRVQEEVGRRLPSQAIGAVSKGIAAKYCSEVCLLAQPWMFDGELNVGQYLEKIGRKLRVHIYVRRFCRIDAG